MYIQRSITKTSIKHVISILLISGLGMIDFACYNPSTQFEGSLPTTDTYTEGDWRFFSETESFEINFGEDVGIYSQAPLTKRPDVYEKKNTEWVKVDPAAYVLMQTHPDQTAYPILLNEGSVQSLIPSATIGEKKVEIWAESRSGNQSTTRGSMYAIYNTVSCTLLEWSDTLVRIIDNDMDTDNYVTVGMAPRFAPNHPVLKKIQLIENEDGTTSKNETLLDDSEYMLYVTNPQDPYGPPIPLLHGWKDELPPAVSTHSTAQNIMIYAKLLDEPCALSPMLYADYSTHNDYNIMVECPPYNIGQKHIFDKSDSNYIQYAQVMASGEYMPEPIYTVKNSLVDMEPCFPDPFYLDNRWWECRWPLFGDGGLPIEHIYLELADESEDNLCYSAGYTPFSLRFEMFLHTFHIKISPARGETEDIPDSSHEMDVKLVKCQYSSNQNGVLCFNDDSDEYEVDPATGEDLVWSRIQPFDNTSTFNCVRGNTRKCLTQIRYFHDSQEEMIPAQDVDFLVCSDFTGLHFNEESLGKPFKNEFGDIWTNIKLANASIDTGIIPRKYIPTFDTLFGIGLDTGICSGDTSESCATIMNILGGGYEYTVFEDLVISEALLHLHLKVSNPTPPYLEFNGNYVIPVYQHRQPLTENGYFVGDIYIRPWGGIVLNIDDQSQINYGPSPNTSHLDYTVDWVGDPGYENELSWNTGAGLEIIDGVLQPANTRVQGTVGNLQLDASMDWDFTQEFDEEFDAIADVTILHYTNPAVSDFTLDFDFPDWSIVPFHINSDGVLSLDGSEVTFHFTGGDSTWSNVHFSYNMITHSAQLTTSITHNGFSMDMVLTIFEDGNYTMEDSVLHDPIESQLPTWETVTNLNLAMNNIQFAFDTLAGKLQLMGDIFVTGTVPGISDSSFTFKEVRIQDDSDPNAIAAQVEDGGVMVGTAVLDFTPTWDFEDYVFTATTPETYTSTASGTTPGDHYGTTYDFENKFKRLLDLDSTGVPASFDDLSGNYPACCGVIDAVIEPGLYSYRATCTGTCNVQATVTYK